MKKLNLKPPPNLLYEFRKSETQKWVDWANEDATQPKGYWADNTIRRNICSNYFQNCVYCQRFTTVYSRKKNDFRTRSGQVDHFLPKKKYPRAVYYWSNLMWSCTDCNESKNVSVKPILNFHSRNDTSSITFNPTTGFYELTTKNQTISKRFKNTESLTHFNMSISAKRNRDAYQFWEVLFLEIFGMLTTLKFVDSKTYSFVKTKAHSNNFIVEARNTAFIALENSPLSNNDKILLEKFLIDLFRKLIIEKK